MRRPDEILAILDSAQEHLDECRGKHVYDLRSLLWEVIEDVIDSARLAAYNAVMNYDGVPPHHVDSTVMGDCVAEEVVGTVTDYVTNHYGDD